MPIRQIAFVKEDAKNKKVVGFIASDPKTNLLLCHVFECEPSVRRGGGIRRRGDKRSK